MKKLLNLLFLSLAIIIAIVSCKKKNSTTTTPATQQQQNPPPAPTPTLTTQEQQLVGLWLMDSMATYVNNARVTATIYTNTLTCRMDFQSTVVAGGGGYYDLQDGHSSCMLSQQIWKAPNNGQFNIATLVFPITLITSTKLHFINGGGGGVEYKYYFHK